MVVGHGCKVVSCCACANTRVPARRRGRLVQSTVQASAMYQRHKLLKRLTLMFLLTSAGLWTIRTVQIYWNPCKNREVTGKIAQIFNHPVAKGVEQQNSVPQSEFIHAQNHTVMLHKLVNVKPIII